MKARNALLAAFTLSTLATAVQAADEVVVLLLAVSTS